MASTMTEIGERWNALVAAELAYYVAVPNELAEKYNGLQQAREAYESAKRKHYDRNDWK